jgi:heme/copper-type cytochrome/quinol oxidase subunit 2
MIKWNDIFLQNGASKTRKMIDLFHDYILFFLLVITIIIFFNIFSLIFNKIINKKMLEFPFLEFLWTILPGGILIFLGVPSLNLLYEIENISTNNLTVKVIGHQWYWSYELRDFNNIEFDSYILNEDYLNLGDFRLLEVDNHLVLPNKTNIRFLVTATDVLHSWAIPSLRLKIDATPGRLNQIFSNVNYIGLFYGQCSEICGRNHSFIPIVLEVTSIRLFKEWVINFSD